MDRTKPDNERTETDERIAENCQPALILPVTRDPDDVGPEGLPHGMADDARSPLDFLTPEKTVNDQGHA